MEEGAFDLETLLISVCDDRELAEQVVSLFLSDIPIQLDELDEALAAGDAETARRIAHSIKGAAATIGGPFLRDEALECEQLGRDGELEAIKARTAALRRLFGELREELLAAGFE